jgi:hypothetical protein
MDSKTLSKPDGETVHCPGSGGVHVVGQDILYDQQSLYRFKLDL